MTKALVLLLAAWGTFSIGRALYRHHVFWKRARLW